MYAPFGAGAPIAPKALFAQGDFLLVGGAVGAVSFDDVIWADGLDRDDAGSPNVIGVVALTASADELRTDGWRSVTAHEEHLLRGWTPSWPPCLACTGSAWSPVTGCRSRRSTSRVCPTARWPPGSPTSTPSAPAAAASARTRTWVACSG